MRRTGVIVGDVSRNGLVFERIVQAGEQLAELLGGKQIKQHQHVGLLRQLVAVCAVILRFENQFEALDVAVPHAVALPIQLG